MINSHSSRRGPLGYWLLAAMIAGCGPSAKRPVQIAADGKAASGGQTTEGEVGKKRIQPPLPPAKAPGPSPRLSGQDARKRIQQPVLSFFEQHRGSRIYIQLDKPLYRPGEAIWIKSWELDNRTFAGAPDATSVIYQLVSPKGAVVMEKSVQASFGSATNDFILPPGVPGGEYLIRAVSSNGQSSERPFIVSAYEPPQIKKKLEFVRKAYGKGDSVQATVELKRPTGEALGHQPVEAVVRMDGAELYRLNLTTNEHGGVLIRFNLPAQIENGDGLLTVLVADGGVTESISKRIPIVLNKVRLSLFPEGGQLVAGVPSRVYFEAQNTLGKPADIEGRVLDDHNHPVADFRSYYQGMGRFELRPASGRRYTVQITKPVGIRESFDLPLATESGCTIKSFDDFDSQLPAIRAAVYCSSPTQVTVSAMMRENLLDFATVAVPADGPAVVYLASKDENLARAQGIVRLTVFDDKLEPVAERLVYRNRRNSLKVDIAPNKPSYTPRDKVELSIKTADAFGAPVSAELCLSVVDDTVVSFADDKTGHLLSRLYLESEIPDTVEEPKVYFDLTEEKAAEGIDMLLGTKGWRRFEWQQVLIPPVPQPSQVATEYAPPPPMAVDEEKVPGMRRDLKEKKERPPRREKAVERHRARMPRAQGARMAPAAPKKGAAPKMFDDLAKEEAAPMEAIEMEEEVHPEPLIAGEGLQELRADQQPLQDKDWDRELAGAAEGPDAGFTKVRVFPVPDYSRVYEGPRTDFRDTVYWAPSVRTGEDGSAAVSFYLSDAVSSFRVFAEGVGAGTAGRNEHVFKSNLPFSMSIKVPVEVSSGDRMKLPLTLTNETDRRLSVTLDADFGQLMQMNDKERRRRIRLAPTERKSMIFDVAVTGTQGESEVVVSADAGGLADSFKRAIAVVPRGFPFQHNFSGQISERARHELDLSDIVAGSASTVVKAYPSPVATMIAGMDGMLRQPCGCFEQASSSNYPNVMIMGYLDQHDVADPALLERSRGLLDQGYQMLTGYESPKKGYEWFGQNPGHEALTAYGLLEFVDMKKVYGEVDQQMIDRTAYWLKSRRDQKGGFERNQLALDSFGAASPEVTDAYITYSLAEAGYASDLPKEIARQIRLAAKTEDAYLLALAANTLLNVPERAAEGKTAAARLAAMQSSDGAWTNADHSITRSGGINLHIETTALAVLALLKADAHQGQVTQAMQWLMQQRDGYGNWGATQATVLGLKTFAAWADATRKTQYPGAITVLINGKTAAEMEYAAGHRGPLTVMLKDQSYFKAGKNTFELVHRGEDQLPYSIAVEYRAATPATSNASPVDLRVTSDIKEVRLGETVRFTVVVTNRRQSGQPMTLTRVGLPGGLSFQTWQLKELRDQRKIDFYETRPREVILYFRSLKPSETREIPLDLVATVPGHYTGPASSTYLYYTDEHKTWTEPISVAVHP